MGCPAAEAAAKAPRTRTVVDLPFLDLLLCGSTESLFIARTVPCGHALHVLAQGFFRRDPIYRTRTSGIAYEQRRWLLRGDPTGARAGPSHRWRSHQRSVRPARRCLRRSPRRRAVCTRCTFSNETDRRRGRRRRSGGPAPNSAGVDVGRQRLVYPEPALVK